MKFTNILTPLLVFLILSSFVTNTHALESPSDKYINNQAYFPKLGVTNITINTAEPEEELPISVTIYVQNNDSFAYDKYVKLHISLREIITDVHRGDTDPPLIVVNQSISLAANSTKMFDIDFPADAGQYTLASYISINDTVIPTSMFSTILQVISAPIGTISELGIAIISIIIVLLTVMLLPAIIDKLRRFKHLKNQ